MSNATEAALVQRYLEEHASLLFLRLDSQGMIVDANRFSRQRLGNDWRRQSWRTIFLFNEEGPDPQGPSPAHGHSGRAS